MQGFCWFRVGRKYWFAKSKCLGGGVLGSWDNTAFMVVRMKRGWGWFVDSLLAFDRAFLINTWRHFALSDVAEDPPPDQFRALHSLHLTILGATHVDERGRFCGNGDHPSSPKVPLARLGILATGSPWSSNHCLLKGAGHVLEFKDCKRTTSTELMPCCYPCCGFCHEF